MHSLYKHLGVSLRAAEFSYSFARLSSTKSTTIRSSTSPPPPCSLSHGAEEPEPLVELLRPAQTPLYLYEGQNGFAWPPLAFPSTLSGRRARILYLTNILFLTLSYFHLLVLAFFYSKTGLTRRRKETSVWEQLGVRSVASEPMSEWCDRHWIGRGMRKEVLEPLYAAVSTVGREEVGALPVGEILEYIVSTFGSAHYVASEGVQQLVGFLSAPLPPSNIHLDMTMTSMFPSPSSPSQTRLVFESSTTPVPALDASPVPPIDFDYVVLATQANQARQILDMYRSSLPEERRASVNDRIAALSTFDYIKTLVVNHFDESILPPNPADRRDLNLASFDAAGGMLAHDSGSENTLPSSSIQATHIIHRTHPALTTEFAGVLCQTTNPLVEVDPTMIISSWWGERAVLSLASKGVLPRFILPDPTTTRPLENKSPAGRGGDLQGHDGIYFTGSWASAGIPLLEGCVQSSERVVADIARREGGWARMPF